MGRNKTNRDNINDRQKPKEKRISKPRSQKGPESGIPSTPKRKKRYEGCSCELTINQTKSEACAIHKTRDSSGNATTSDTVTVVFDLTLTDIEDCEIISCEVNILDQSGATINTYQTTAVVGTNTFNWDLKDSGGNVVKQGCYQIVVGVIVSSGAMCFDQYKVTVVELGEIVKRSKANHTAYINNFNSPMKSKDRWACWYLALYREMIVKIQNCFLTKLSAQMSGGQKKFPRPCYIACITANLAELLNKEFKFPDGKIWEVAELAGSTLTKGGAVGPPQTFVFFMDILRVENKLRGEAMYKCCSCVLTPSEKNEIIDCVKIGAPPGAPGFVIEEQMDSSTKHCMTITTAKPDCPIPTLK